MCCLLLLLLLLLIMRRLICHHTSIAILPQHGTFSRSIIQGVEQAIVVSETVAERQFDFLSFCFLEEIRRDKHVLKIYMIDFRINLQVCLSYPEHFYRCFHLNLLKPLYFLIHIFLTFVCIRFTFLSKSE